MKSEPTPHPPLWYRLFRKFLQVAARVLFRLRIEGMENVPAGNYIVIANHLGWIDPFLLTLALPAEPRLYFIGAQQALNRWWKAWLIRSFDIMIPFERGATWLGKDVLIKSLQVLRAGAVLGLFPERNPPSPEGELHPLQRGIGHLVLKAGVPVLPVALTGAQELYLRKPITLFIGKPFRVGANGLDRHAEVDAAVDQASSTLSALLPHYVEPKATIKLMRFLTKLLG